jgi:hypothetical protein
MIGNYMQRVILIILCVCSLLLNCNPFDLGTKVNISGTCGCESEPITAFSKTYVNWAWGYTHNGWHLSNLGRIDSFSYTKSDSLWLLSDDSLITATEMSRINSRYTPTSQTIKQSTLDSMVALIPLAAAGPWTKKNLSADMGAQIYSAYYYDSEAKQYRNVILYQYGDWNIVNESDAAKKLTTWLMAIDSVENGKN